MTSRCYTPWKVPKVRATQLNSCGTPVTGCSTVVTDGIISVAMTKEYEARQEFFIKNGNGDFCVKQTNPPILKWINLVLTFCNVDPELVNIMSANPTYLNDAVAPVSIGYSEQEGTASNAFFALEMWTLLASNASIPCTGGVQYGYTIFPFVVEGTVGDITYENGAANFILNARTAAGSNWGTGPYNVSYSDNPAGSLTPKALFTPIGATQHMRQFITRFPPPTASCGCTTLSSLIPS